ncbi:chemotaxis protein CheW [Candidatus Reidiella endopervernicosa]|nr:chemotaxis protein CheW [Candidatus Reidiella endopervernicosa]QKQ28251.1 chemotaxis protein CheW [Candidatus Reidiella endopervernicosa]
MVEAQKNPISRWVTFRLADESYGIDVMQVREVLRNTEISPVPGAPGYVLGIINLRGNVVSIIDTRTRFGLPIHEADDSSRILILETADTVIGFLVDSVNDVAELNAADIEPAPDTGSGNTANYISGLSNRESGLLILLDSNKMLTEEEMMELNSL